MVDQFDIQRDLDNQGGDLEDRLMGELQDTKDKEAERAKHLVQLGGEHYFDRQGKVVLERTAGKYVPLEHVQTLVAGDPAQVQSDAVSAGYREVHDGIFWNAELKHLYVKQDGHFVLYSRGQKLP